jgi:solute:Na+ symporter, SSS family
MLILAICLYMIGTIALGLYASSKVHSSKDFMVAGRSLPLYMNLACVFATWFGAETLLSISATFTRDGIVGISGDPFGAAMCLMLVAIFFARAFYRMELMTIGDFYHKRYGKVVEVITSMAITISYLGWTSAQLTALGLVIWVLGGNQMDITLTQSIVIGAVIVTLYTLFGGMWSIALTDLVQTAAIVIGLIVVAYIIGDKAGGFSAVISHAREAGKFQAFPDATGKSWGLGTQEWLAFIAAFLTFGLGSIPQQDVFQRVTSAKNESTAVHGTLLGGMFYFLFAFIPMYIAYSAVVLDGKYLELFAAEDPRAIQRILPEMILQQTPVWTQILFFGALLSAILSTASGAILAPASLFTENVLQPLLKHLDDKTFLWVIRSVLVLFSLVATAIALRSTSTMYEMVQNAYKVTLVGAFIPLAMGLYWKKSTTQGALASIVLGIGSWLGYEAIIYYTSIVPEGVELPEDYLNPWTIMPPQFVGLFAAFIGMVAGSLLPQWIGHQELDDEAFKERKTRSSSLGH